MDTALVEEKIKNFPGIKFVMRMRNRRKFWNARSGNYFWGVYSSFASAKNAIPTSANVGYDHPSPAQLYRDMIGRVDIRDYALLFWLQRLLTKDSRLLDFGGHFGIKYFNFRNRLSQLPDQPWTIYDVPAVVAAGRQYMEEQGEQGATFINSTEGYSCDIFFASGSLQYLSHSLSDELLNLASLPEHVLIGSLPVHHHHGFFTLQNIGVAISPYQIFGFQELLDDMENLNYSLVDHWMEVDKSCYIPQHPKHSLRHYEGFYFRLNK